MNPELKQKWIAALRSGQRKQAQGVLRKKDGGFCCLGVLIDVYQPEKWIDPGLEASCYVYDGWGGGSLPVELVKELDISTDLVKELDISTDTVQALICMNDDRGKTFPEIADWIEVNL
jgi:hypothetical protein